MSALASFAERAAPYVDGSAFGRAVAVFPLWWPADSGCACPRGPSCERPAKHPLTVNGMTAASADPAVVAAWSARWPAANIGLPLAANGLCALDVDGAAGLASLREYVESPLEVPLTTVTTTGRGAHLLYSTPAGRRGRGTAGIAPGLDLRGPNYLVAPGSVHASGARYEWDVPPWRVPPAMAPGWMLMPVASATSPRPPAAIPLAGATGTAYGVAALRALLEEVASTVPGSRHARLFWAARRVGELAREGHLDPGQAQARLAAAAAHAFAGEAAEAEIANAIRDGFAKAAA